MLVGLDFDNTIVGYDRVFHTAARERGLIDAATPASKIAVRDELRRRDVEDAWTELQGYVYGCRMADAELFPGVVEVLQWARSQGLDLAIVSHKTRHPFLGPKYDLHRAAREWIESHLCDRNGPLVSPDRVSFRQTKAEKIARIDELGCDVYVDDLPEILLAEAFPTATRRILFDPAGNYLEEAGLEHAGSWLDIRALIDS